MVLFREHLSLILFSEIQHLSLILFSEIQLHYFTQIYTVECLRVMAGK